MRSSCPRVIGSKLPAQMAVVATSLLAAKEGDCGRAVFPRGSAVRQRPQTKRPRASVQIEDSRIGNVQLKYAHPGLANAIKGRSNVHAFWCAYSSPSPATGDYAQDAGGGRGWAGSGKREAGSGRRI